MLNYQAGPECSEQSAVCTLTFAVLFAVSVLKLRQPSAGGANTRRKEERQPGHFTSTQPSLPRSNADDVKSNHNSLVSKNAPP